MKIARTTNLTATQEPRVLAWDTEFFGIRIAATDHPAVDQWALDNTIDLTCLLANPDEPERIQEAEEQGFRYVDTRVELAQQTFGAWVETERIRPIRPEDVDLLALLARRAHRITRFYADPRFNRMRCDDLYEGWLRNSADGWAREVLVAVEGERPCGYCTVHVRGGTASIGLIAVDEAARGKGIGAALTRAAIWLAHSQPRRREKRMTVVTQGRNAAALATFQKAGFRVVSTKVWLHRWSAS